MVPLTVTGQMKPTARLSHKAHGQRGHTKPGNGWPLGRNGNDVETARVRRRLDTDCSNVSRERKISLEKQHFFWRRRATGVIFEESRERCGGRGDRRVLFARDLLNRLPRTAP